ncbi:hypothetical protein niasHT_000920 [Heterodera trifolii]|uniref:Uncharacterized protein n=1 Tax=Heterodera trifolii TaxID=157864 RepID=A0ABD2LTX5_9BILA
MFFTQTSQLTVPPQSQPSVPACSRQIHVNVNLAVIQNIVRTDNSHNLAWFGLAVILVSAVVVWKLERDRSSNNSFTVLTPFKLISRVVRLLLRLF